MGYPGLCKRTLHTNTYQFHFFVLPVIFKPNPKALYLCSQLASVTKGLCKPLLQANRFPPTSTASYAVPICPPGMHENMSPIFFFPPLVLTLHYGGQWGGKRRMRNRGVNKSRKPRSHICGRSHFVSLTYTYSKLSTIPHLP